MCHFACAAIIYRFQQTAVLLCSFVDQVRPEPPKLHSFEAPDGSLATFPTFRVIKRIQSANRPDFHGP
jgi:hypothetical protein